MASSQPEYLLEELRFLLVAALIHALAQFLSGFEVDRIFAVHLHRLPGARVSSDIGAVRFECEGTESSDLNALPFAEGVGHGLENAVDGFFRATARNFKVFCELGNQLRLGHV